MLMEQIKERRLISVEELVERLPESALKKSGKLNLRKYAGIIRFEGDPVAYQRKLRNEWK